MHQLLPLKYGIDIILTPLSEACADIPHNKEWSRKKNRETKNKTLLSEKLILKKRCYYQSNGAHMAGRAREDWQCFSVLGIGGSGACFFSEAPKIGWYCCLVIFFPFFVFVVTI